MYLTINFEGEQRTFDLFKFSKYVLGYDKLQKDPHERWCQQAERRDKRSLYLKPRGTYKSTLFTISDTIWRLLENPNLRILITNATDRQAKQFLSEISGHYLRNDKLRDVHWELYGCDPLDANSSTTEKLTLNSRSIIRKEPSIGVIGALSNVVSSHYDIIKVDDLCNLEDQESEATREKKKRWFKNLIPILTEGGELQVVGTRWHDQDCYDYIINHINPKLSDKYHIEIEPCWLDDGVTPRFPTILSKEKLESLKAELGILVFACQEELQPLSSEHQIFKPENIKTIKHSEIEISKCDCYAALDLSKGGEDLASLCSVARLPDNKLLCYHADIELDTPAKSAKKLVTFHRLWGYKKAWVEFNTLEVAESAWKAGNRTSFENELLKESEKAGVQVPYVPIWHTQNKQARIRSLDPYYNNGTLLFWDTYLDDYPTALTQMFRFPMGHDDFPDSLETVVSGILNDISIDVGWGTSRLKGKRS